MAAAIAVGGFARINGVTAWNNIAGAGDGQRTYGGRSVEVNTFGRAVVVAADFSWICRWSSYTGGDGNSFAVAGRFGIKSVAGKIRIIAVGNCPVGIDVAVVG